MAQNRGGMSDIAKNVISNLYANVKPQQEAQRQYFNTLARRMGNAGAMQFGAQISAPYAQEASQAAAGQAMNIERLEEQKAEYEKNLAQRQAEFKKNQENWEKNYQLQKDAADMQKLLAGYQTTGTMSPDLMKLFGYSDLNRGDMMELQRQMQMLGMKMPGSMGTTSGVGGINYKGVTYGRNHPMLKYI